MKHLSGGDMRRGNRRASHVVLGLPRSFEVLLVLILLLMVMVVVVHLRSTKWHSLPQQHWQLVC